jgi:hypothetical protein
MNRPLRVPVFWLFLAFALVPLVAKFGAEGYLLSLATRALIFAMAALSLNLIMGYGALVSFGHFSGSEVMRSAFWLPMGPTRLCCNCLWHLWQQWCLRRRPARCRCGPAVSIT